MLLFNLTQQIGFGLYGYDSRDSIILQKFLWFWLRTMRYVAGSPGVVGYTDALGAQDPMG
jgi:hypothetical protein